MPPLIFWPPCRRTVQRLISWPSSGMHAFCDVTEFAEFEISTKVTKHHLKWQLWDCGAWIKSWLCPSGPPGLGHVIQILQALSPSQHWMFSRTSVLPISLWVLGWGHGRNSKIYSKTWALNTQKPPLLTEETWPKNTENITQQVTMATTENYHLLLLL